MSTTGHGESITKVCLAHRVVQAMQDEHPKKVFSNSIPTFASMTHDPRQGVMVWRTCRIGLAEVVELLRSMSLEGGTFLKFKYLTHWLPRWAAEFTTVRMPWSAITRNHLTFF